MDIISVKKNNRIVSIKYPQLVIMVPIKAEVMGFFLLKKKQHRFCMNQVSSSTRQLVKFFSFQFEGPFTPNDYESRFECHVPNCRVSNEYFTQML